MSFSGSVRDRLAIRELLERYADAVCRHDAQAWADCWIEEGVWEFAGARLAGRETMVATWKAAMAPFALISFHVQPGLIRIEQDRAEVRSYTREFFVLNDGGRRHICGRYDDEIVRTGEEWHFALRRYHLLSDDRVPAAEP